MSTNAPMTQEQLDAIQEREAKATAGPWDVEGSAYCGPLDTLAAHEDVPALLAEVDRLRARLTVNDDMVKRATHGIAAHWHDMHTNGSLGRQEALAVAALEAALGTGEGS